MMLKLSTVEKITNLLGLDFSGKETVPIEALKQKQAKEKAIFMASLVQSTSSLEEQGLEKKSIEEII